MPNYDLGTAHGTIKIDYDKSGFAAAKADLQGSNLDLQNLQQQMDGLNKSFDDFGKNAKKSVADVRKEITNLSNDLNRLNTAGAASGGINVPVTADTKDVDKQVDDSVRRNSNKKLSIKTEADMKNFADNLAKTAAQMRQIIKVPVEIDRNKFAQEMAKLRSELAGGGTNTVKVKAEVDKNSFVRDLGVLGGLAMKALSGVGSIIGSAFNGLVSAGSAVGSMFGNLSTLATGFIERVSAGFSNVAGGLGNIAAIAGQVLGVFIQVGAQGAMFAGIGAAITAAFATVVAAIDAVPAAIGLIGVAAASVMLGMDGIKKAAQSIKPEFDKMKAAISSTFEKGLTPVFKQLATTFPAITQGLQGTATALTGIAQKFADWVTKANGLSVIQTIITNANTALSQMSPYLVTIVANFLKLASSNAAMQVLVGTVQQLSAGFDSFVQTVTADGSLDAAMQGLQGLLESLVRLFTELMTAGTQAFSTMAPGLQQFVDGIRDLVQKIDWKAVGKAIGDVFGGIGQIISSIPQGTIDNIVAAFQRMGDLFKNASFQADIKKITEVLPDFIDFVTQLIAWIAKVGAAAVSLKQHFDKMATDAEGFATRMQNGTTGNSFLDFDLGKWVDDAFKNSGATDQLHTIGDTIAKYFTVTLPQQLSGLKPAGGGGFGEMIKKFLGFDTIFDSSFFGDFGQKLKLGLEGLFGANNIFNFDFSGFFQQIGTALSTGWQAFQGTLNSLFPDASGGQGIIDNIKKALGLDNTVFNIDFSGIFASVGTAISTAWGAFTGTLSSLFPAASGANGIWENVKKALGVDTVFDFDFSGTFASVGTALSTAWGAFTGTFSTLFPNAGTQLWEGIKKALGIDTVFDFDFSAVGQQIVAGLQRMIEGLDLSGIGKSIWDKITSAITGGGGGGGGGSAVAGFGSGMKTIDLGMFGGGGAAGGDILGIQPALDAALAAINAFGPAASAAMTAAMTQVTTAATTASATIGTAFTTAFTTLGPTIGTALTTAITTALAPVWTTVGQLISTGLSTAIGPALGPAMALVGTQVSQALTLAFTTAIPLAMTTLGQLITTSLTTTVGPAITLAFTTLGTTITTTFQTTLTTAFTTVFATLGTTIGTQLTTAITTAFTTAQAAVTTAVTTLLTPLNTMGTQVNTAFTTAFSGVSAAINTGMSGAVQAVQQGAQQIVQAVQQIGPQVSQAVTGQDWNSVGQGITQGILAGIQAGWPALVQAVQQLAQQLLAQALGALGIASPSKEFFYVGAMMMKGWIGGILKHADGIFNAVGGIISWIMSAGRKHHHWHWPGPKPPPKPPDPPPPPPPPSTGVGWNPYDRPTGSSWAPDPFMNGPINVTIDAKTVAEINSVTDFFDTVRQTARAGKAP